MHQNKKESHATFKSSHQTTNGVQVSNEAKSQNIIDRKITLRYGV